MATPAGAQDIAGLVSRQSPFPVEQTVSRLADAAEAAGAKVFAVVYHSGEAALEVLTSHVAHETS